MSETPAIVTGLPGWLGNRFLQVLLNNVDGLYLNRPLQPRQIKVLNNSSLSAEQKIASNNPLLKFVLGDVRDKDSIKPLFQAAEGGTVFHIAGLIHPKFISEFYSVNLDGTRNMLELAQEVGIRRFIYVSSNSPCGTNASNQDLFDENSAYNPYLNYGNSKMQAEKLIMSFSDRIETVILRPPWFYGPEQPPRQSLFFKLIRTGKVPIVGDGLNKRSMVYVDNLCQALLLAESTAAAKGQIYWIADKSPYTMKGIVRTIETVLEQDFNIPVAHKHLQLPNFVGDLAYYSDKLIQSFGLYNQKIHVLSEFNKTIACNIEKAEKELGYSPSISLEEGMRRSIDWLLKKGIKF